MLHSEVNLDVPGSANLHIAGSRGQFADTNLFSIDNTYIESVAAALAVWEISRASGSCDRDPVNSLCQHHEWGDADPTKIRVE